MTTGVEHGRNPIDVLQARRSVSPRRLAAPGPDRGQLQTAVGIALRAPDHGGLTPWRVIQIAEAQRVELARLFAEEKRRRDPLASSDDIARAREHALNAPALLAFIVCIRAGVTVPAHEQWLAAGAALGNVLNALHVLGFGAIVLSGDRCSDVQLTSGLGLGPGEQLCGFISAGTVADMPPVARPKPIDLVWSLWQGAAESSTLPIAQGPTRRPR